MKAERRLLEGLKGIVREPSFEGDLKNSEAGVSANIFTILGTCFLVTVPFSILGSARI